MKHDGSWEAPGKLIDSPVKVAIVPQVIDRLMIPPMSIGKGGYGVNIKLILKFSNGRLSVVIEINIKVGFEAFE